MRAFYADAQSIFETSQSAAESGAQDCDFAILIGPHGHIQIREAAGWALASLADESGVRTAYRVTRERGRTRLEGRSGSQTCVFGSELEAHVARQLLGAPAAYVCRPAAPALLAAAQPPYPLRFEYE